MARRCFWSVVAVGCSAVLALDGAQANGQSAGAAGSPTFVSPGGSQPTGGRSNPAVEFFGGARFAAYNQPVRTVTPPPPMPVQTAAAMKPFTYVPQGDSVSPYLALDQRESDFGVPNYYLYVRPQLDQQATNQRQIAQLRRMQQQMRQANAGAIVPRGTSGGIPTTGHSSQFMNSGSYYPTLK